MVAKRKQLKSDTAEGLKATGECQVDPGALRLQRQIVEPILEAKGR